MFRGKIRFIFTLLLVPLMTSSRTHEDEFELQSVTPRMFDLQQIHFDFQNQRVLITEQIGQKFCVYDLHSGKTTCTATDQPAGAMVPIVGFKNKFAAGIGPYFGILEWDGVSHHSKFKILRSIKSDGCEYQLLKISLADKHGRLWIGSESLISAGLERQKGGNLYHYTTDMCNLKTVIERVTTTNALAWNLDYTKIYFAGCSQYRIDVYDYNIRTGKISNQRPFLDFQARKIDGVPHGMTPDENGDFWIGCYEGSQIIKVDSETAKILKIIKLPVSHVTDLAWGGPHLNILYVTTSRLRLTKEEEREQPLAGTVIAITGLKERGLPANNAVICQEVEYFRLINNRGKPNITFDDCCEEFFETQENNVLNCV